MENNLYKEFLESRPAIKPSVIAKEVGINRSSFYDILAGATPRPYTAARIEAVLNKYGYQEWLQKGS